MLTKERLEELKAKGIRDIYYCGGREFPVQRCCDLHWDERFADLFYETEIEAATIGKTK